MEQGAGCGGGGGTEQGQVTGETASTGLTLSWIRAPREVEEWRVIVSFHWHGLWGRWGDHPPRLRAEDGAGRPGGAHLSLTGLPLLLGAEPVPRDKSPEAGLAQVLAFQMNPAREEVGELGSERVGRSGSRRRRDEAGGGWPAGLLSPQIQRAIHGNLQKHTVLIIAHRLSTVERAHLIVVLDKGRVVQQGTHQQLLAQGGLYAKLVQRQMLGLEPSLDCTASHSEPGSGGHKA